MPAVRAPRRPRKVGDNAWQLPVLADVEIFALKAVCEGKADADQQRLAWAVIREKLCQCELMSFWPGGEDGRRGTDFAEGKRWVAIQMRRLSRLAPSRVDPRGPPPPMPPKPEVEQPRGE